MGKILPLHSYLIYLVALQACSQLRNPQQLPGLPQIQYTPLSYFDFFFPFPSKTCFESPLFFFLFFQTSPSAEVAGPCSLHLSFHHALLYVISLVSSQRRRWMQQASQSGKQSFLFCVQGNFLYKKIAQSINICCEQRH